MATNQGEADIANDAGRGGRDRDRNTNPDANRDPITGAPGSHPAGTAAGATVGGLGAAAVGAAIGSVVPGIGTAVGGVIGAVVGAAGGGVAGHEIAESINPTVEDAYWRENYKTRPYVSSNDSYDDYAPAYRYGWESRSRNAGRRFSDVEDDLSRGWDKAKANSRLGWENAKAATRDAWTRIDTSGSRRDASDASLRDTSDESLVE